MTDFMVSLPKLAADLEVDESALLRFVRDGVCPPPIIVGGLARFNADELRAWRNCGCPAGEPVGHRRLHAIRRAMMDEADERFATVSARLSDLLDNATPEVLRQLDVYL